MRTLLTTLFAVLLPCMHALAQRDCTYCKGTGKIIKNIEISNYGNPTKEYCTICKKSFYGVHTHINCVHCGGTGKLASYTTPKNETSHQDKLDQMAEANPEAYRAAMNTLYGYPMSDEEYRIYKDALSTEPAQAKEYEKVRGLMNAFFIKINEANARAMYKYSTPEYVDSQYENMTKQINRTWDVPDALCPYLDKMNLDAYKLYKSYRSTCDTFTKLRKQQEALDNMLIYGY